MKGEIKLEGLNLRPDGVNEVLDKSEKMDNILNNFEDVMASKMDNPTGVITVKAKITQTIPAVEPPEDP